MYVTCAAEELKSKAIAIREIREAFPLYFANDECNISKLEEDWAEVKSRSASDADAFAKRFFVDLWSGRVSPNQRLCAVCVSPVSAKVTWFVYLLSCCNKPYFQEKSPTSQPLY
jgi:hypothetical protein